MKSRFNISLLLILLSFFSALKAEEDKDVIEFALITDTHGYGPTADIRSAIANTTEFVKYCNEHPRIKFALFGGDFMNDYDTDHTQALWCLTHARQDFADLRVPFYTTKGNHDCNGKQKKADRTPDNSQIITDLEYYKLFSPLSEDNPNYHPEGIVVDEDNPYGNYYYRDFESHRVRLIVLNNYDLDYLEVYGYHGKQMKWIAEKALDFSEKEEPTKWCFLMVGHAFSVSYNNNPLTRLMHAYKEGSDFSDTDSGVFYRGRFNQPRAQFVGMLSGHFHYSMYNNSEGYNMIRFDRGFATGGEVFSQNVSFSHLILNIRQKTLEEKHIGRGRSRLFRYDQPTQVYPTMAFPEADGMGAEVSGGRAGKVIHVTNLNDSGKGSLRWAIEQRGSRTIVFDVSGLIHLKSPLVIDHDSVTIAGQTSPGNGIVLNGPMKIHASEVILRYLEFNNQYELNRKRAKKSGEEFDIALTDGGFGLQNIMIDHLTFNWVRSSALSIKRAEGVSVQFCRFNAHPSDSLLVASAIEAGGFKTTYHHNLITDWPNAIHFPDEPGCNRWIHFVRNVVSNWRDHAMYGGGNQGEFTIEDNYCIPGPQTQRNIILDVAEDGTGRYYFKYNSVKGLEEYDRNNKMLVNDRSGLPFDFWKLDREIWSSINPVITPQMGNFAATCMVISAFHSRSMFHSPSHEATLKHLYREAGNSYRPQPVASNLLDTDGDGMPDYWEDENGLDKNDSADALQMNKSLDYTNLEFYLNELVKPDKTIILLFDNDTYGNYLPYPYLAGYRNLVAADSAYVGIVSNGNALTGSWIAEETSGQAIAELRRRVGYDAINLGPADLDLPYAHLKQLMKGIRAPFVSANLVLEDGSQPFAPSVIHTYGRKKVAFIGISATEFTGKIPFLFSDPDQEPQLKMANDVVAKVQYSVDKARESGASYVVLLSQLGDSLSSQYLGTRQLIEQTYGIDAVIDGSKSQEDVNFLIKDKRGKDVLVTRIGYNFNAIGKMTISPDGVFDCKPLPITQFSYKDPASSAICDSVSRMMGDLIKENVKQ